MTFQSRNLDNPDETRKFTHGEIRLLTVSGAVVGRAVFQPGWRWSEDVKPIAGTESCEAAIRDISFPAGCTSRWMTEPRAIWGLAMRSSSRPATTRGSSVTRPALRSTGPPQRSSPSLLNDRAAASWRRWVNGHLSHLSPDASPTLCAPGGHATGRRQRRCRRDPHLSAWPRIRGGSSPADGASTASVAITARLGPR